MSPKSLLRHPEVISDKSAFFTGNRFQEVYDDPAIDSKGAKKVKRLILCTGKIYYDLLERKRAEDRQDVALVRVEQLYPLPAKQLKEVFTKYSKAEFYWVQEEPSNMGAWQYMNNIFLSDEIGMKSTLQLISRKSSASPATGFKNVHDAQQKAIVDKAFDL